MRYWTYYLAWSFFAYALQEPWLLVGVAVFLLLRSFIPDPGALFRAMRRTRALRAQVDVNAANVTARRDLAIVYLDVLRPRAALTLLEEALARHPDDPEILYLCGLALHRIGRHDEALPRVVQAVQADPRLRFGQPYLVAGDALLALKRWEAAIDAYERYADSNSSDVAGYTRLARAHAGAGDREAAHRSLAEGIHTWHVLPSSMKQRAFGRYLEAQWARVWLLRQPMALVYAAAIVLFALLAIRSAYPLAMTAIDSWR